MKRIGVSSLGVMNATRLLALTEPVVIESHQQPVAALVPYSTYLAMQTVVELQAEIARVTELLNTPEIHDFAKAVVLEAAHQRERWPAEHDAGKTDADWFWLIGYLAGKALHNPTKPDADPVEKRLHRIITVAAAAANWHAQVSARSKAPA